MASPRRPPDPGDTAARGNTWLEPRETTLINKIETTLITTNKKVETVVIKKTKISVNPPLRQNSNESFQKNSRQNSNESFKVKADSPRQNSDPKSETKDSKIEEITKVAPKVASPKKIISPPKRVILPKETTTPPKVTSPPVLISKLTRVNSIVEINPIQKSFKPDVVVKDVPRVEKPAFAPVAIAPIEKIAFTPTMPLPLIPTEEIPPPPPPENMEPTNLNEENNGVGDKIKIFEKAAENAATAGRLSRPGSMRRPRTERLPSDELPPPPPPELSLSPAPLSAFERQPSLTRVEFGSSRWPRNDNETEELPRPRPEPQKIIRPEFRPLASPAEVTIRSPSLGAKIPERFPSHGTAFRNVAPSPAPVPAPPVTEDPEEHHKGCKTRGKYSVSRGSSYFTRGSEEIWLVKKKDIEEIEERVLDSFRRSGGPPGNNGAATLGRGRRMYARSESLEPASVPRAHTLKRQSSVACTCGHDKKTRARSADSTAPPRLRSRSHGDENNQAHVLDKYETLV